MKWNALVLAFLLSPTGLIAQQGVVKPALTSKSTVSKTSNTTPSQPIISIEPVDSSAYVIGPQDHIQVTVWKETAISGPVLVRPDGMITVPLIGDLRAAGLTPSTLGKTITTRLAKYINNPDVTVSILNVHPKQIFLLGEVQHVGPVVMTAGMTILQALSAAGGLTPFANSKHLYILRSTHGKEQKLPFNYKSAIKNGNQQGIVLLVGDTIVVP